VLTVWSFDTFAYLAGRTFRRGRFLNHISPNKTWSGVIGGTIAAVVTAAVLTHAAGYPWIGGLGMGLVLAVAAQAGDVAESMLKRTARAKDSGTLIPGHGGVLDRVDSFLFAAPVVFAYLLLLQ
jgi:phosphatidate cytidylyltransferase